MNLRRTLDPGPFELRLVAQPLTVDAFAPFGEVIELPAQGGLSVNQGRALRFDPAADLSGMDGIGKLALALYLVDPSTMPLEVSLFERHPTSAQLFLPMTCESYVIIVAPARSQGQPATQQACAFIAGRGQGILYRQNVWHHPIVAIGGVAQFAMLMRETGKSDDCIEHRLPHPLCCAME